jgi:hypothetical protein
MIDGAGVANRTSLARVVLQSEVADEAAPPLG